MPIKWKVDDSDGNFVLVGQWEHGGIIGQWGPDGSARRVVMAQVVQLGAINTAALQVPGIYLYYAEAPSGELEYREVAAQRLATGQWGADGSAIAAVQPDMRGIPIGEKADGSSIYAEEVSESDRKGKFALICANPVCSCEPARWHANDPDGFGQAGAYYCEGCAADINRRVSLMHPDRGPACQLV